tara:strand:- start:1280 stop:1951 length:672 start_codon:yes stop_codon:yes gene_type:complete
MRLIYSISKALDKWLKTELPSFEGTRKGRKTLVSDANSLCWQLHIIDNCYQSSEKTIIATEAHSRFTCFIPVTSSLTLSELHQKLTMLWQALLVDMINAERLCANSDAMLLLSKLTDLPFDIQWVKNTDLSISGHITDAALWVTQTLEQQRSAAMSPNLANNLAMNLNQQVKRVKKRQEKFIPINRLFNYCQQITNDMFEAKSVEPVAEKFSGNVVKLSDYRK